MERLQHFIAGEFVEGAGQTIVDVNPTNGEPIAEIPVATAEEVDRAVAAARKALDAGWERSAPAERRKALLRLAQSVAEDAMELGRLATEDMGMPLAFTTGEPFFCAEYLEYFAGWADKLEGSTIPVSQPDVFDYTLKEPVGVVAAIVP